MNRHELATSLFRVLETGDPELAGQVVAADNDNREAVVAPAACRLPGPSGALASSAWMRSAFEDLRFPIQGIAEGEKEIWVRLRMQGRHTGPFVRFTDGKLDQVVPPTGKKIDFEQIHVLTIHEGRITRHEAVRDDITLLGQLTVFPPNPATLARMAFWRLSGKAARAAAAVSSLADEAARLV
jgi:predicted ester cyclase